MSSGRRQPFVKSFLTEGSKISQLAKLHARSYGAIKARIIKLEML
jgi:hypothetical protein